MALVKARLERLVSTTGCVALLVAVVSGVGIAQTSTLTIAGILDGDGTVTSSPAGINCNVVDLTKTGTCTAAFPNGTPVTLTATPAPQTSIASWSLPGCGTATTCSTTVTENRTVHIGFNPTRYSLTIAGAGNGTGRVVGARANLFLGQTDIGCNILPGGATAGACTSQFPLNKRIELRVEFPVSGTNRLVSLSAPCVNSSCRGNMPAGPATIVATLEASGFVVTSAGGNGQGTVVSTAGNVSIDCAITPTSATGSCSETYTNKNPSVTTLTATAASGSRFAGWSGACSGTAPCTFFPGSGITQIQANFATASATTFEVRILGGSDGDGNIKSSPTGIDCNLKAEEPATGTCTGTFAAGTQVTLTATPATLNSFARWEGSGCGTAPTCQFTVTTATSVHALFDPTRFPLTIVGAGTAGGRISGLRGTGFLGIPELGCTITLDVEVGTCTTQYPANKKIWLQLTTNAAGAIGFPHYTAPCGTPPGCGGIMPPAPTTIVVTFRGPGFRIATAGGAGAGKVTTTGNLALDCDITPSGTTGTCQELYIARIPGPLTLTATPSPGSRFVGFTGLCTSTATTCQFVPTTPIDFPTSLPEVRANFAPAAVALTVKGAGTGSGSVTSVPNGVSCTITAGVATGACEPSFAGGAQVALTAAPNAGSTFTGWSGACSGSGTCNVMLNTPQSVTAQFAAITPTIAVTGTGSGSVSSVPAGLSCTLTNGATSGTCSAVFAFGAGITLTAAPAAGWVFAGWGGDCSGTGTCQPNVTANRAVVANFVRATLALKITGTGNGDGLVKAPSVGLNCPIAKGGGKEPDCTVLVAQDVSVTLTADPQGGSVFAGWSGDGCSGNALTCNLTISQARNIVAHFKAPKQGRDIATALLGGAALEAAERDQLDRFGNKDGTFNLGDLLALLDRTGERLTPATTQALIEADRRAAKTPSTSTRRTP